MGKTYTNTPDPYAETAQEIRSVARTVSPAFPSSASYLNAIAVKVETLPGATSIPDCKGVLGRLFGHKFVKSGWTSNGRCFRCGTKEA